MNKIRHILTTILLLSALTAVAQQEVVIRITRKTNPLPPHVSSYIVQPAQYFNISVTNPLDEAQDVYFGVSLHQMTVEGGQYAIQDIYTPTDVQPPSTNYVMHLLPSTTKVLNPLQINDLFAWYNSSEISGLDGILSNLNGNAIGLLPEGHYKVTLSAYDLNTGTLVSNPDVSWCEFDIRYNADPPEFVQAADKAITAFIKDDYTHRDGYRVEFDDLPIVSIDLNKKDNWFKWSRCAMTGINPVPSADYTFEIYRLKGLGALSLDEIGANLSYRLAYWSKQDATELKVPALNDNTLYKYGDFFAVRVVAKPKVIDSSNPNYMVVKNDGASKWLIVYNTEGAKSGDLAEDKDPVDYIDDETLDVDWKLQLTYPNIKVNGKDNEKDGFAPRYLTADKDGNLVIEWDKPTKLKANEADKESAKLFDKLEFTYDVGIYKIPEENSKDLAEILKGEPLTINKDIKADKDGKLKTTLKFKDISEKVEFYTNYIFVVTPKVAKPETKEGEIVWTGAGNNCYTFAFLLTAAREFKGCNADDKFSEDDPTTGIDMTKGWQWKEIPDEIKDDTEQKWKLYVGNVQTEKAFSLRLLPGVKRKKALKDLKEGEASQFTGECVVQWNPTVGGKKLYVNIKCDLKDVEFNADGHMVAGTCKSKQRSDLDWIPYNLIEFTKMKASGAFEGISLHDDNARVGAVSKWVGDRFSDAGDAIQDGLSKALAYAMKPETLKSMAGSYYDKITGYGQGAADIYSLIDACFETDLKSNPITLPMRFPPDLVDKIHTDISLMSMEFTPVGASMDALMLFNMPGGDKIEYDTIFAQGYPAWESQHPELFKDDKGNPLADDKLDEAKTKAKEQYKTWFEEKYADVFGGKKGEEKNFYNSANGLSYSKVLSFTITDMCMEQGRLWCDTGAAALTFDMDIHDTSNNFYFSFKAPKDPEKIKSLDSMDGCVFRWENMGSEDFSFQLGLAGEFRIPDLLDESGKENVKVGFGFITQDWEDFTVDLHMDPFRVPDCDDYLFRPGKILWDHSTKSNPAGLKFPNKFAGRKAYDWSKYFPGEDFSNADFGDDGGDIRWQGLYIEDIGVEFPGAIAIEENYNKYTYEEDVYETDDDGETVLNSDGTPKVKYKAGDPILDEDGKQKVDDEKTNTTYTGDGSRRFTVGLSNFIFDRSGVSLCGGVKNLFKVSTAKMGGWSLSIDNVNFNVVQNNFEGCGFDGGVKIPLMNDTIQYKCEIEVQTKEYLDQHVHLLSAKTDNKVYGPKDRLCHLVFQTSTPKNANFDFILAKGWIDEKGSWIKINHLPGHGTDIEMMMSGVLTIGSENEKHTGGKVDCIPFEIPGVRFAGMRISNFSASAKTEIDDPDHKGKKKESDYASDFATQWVNDHKEDVLSMSNSKLNQVIKGFDIAIDKNGSDKEKEAGYKSWAERMAQTIKDREIDLAAKSSDGSIWHTYFSMGDWSLASPQKSFFNMDFNIKNWGFKMEDKDQNGEDLGKNTTMIRLGIVGSVNLVKKVQKDDSDSSDPAAIAAASSNSDSEPEQKSDGSFDITADCGLSLCMKVKYSFSSISDWSIKYDHIDVDSVAIDCTIGGMITLKGGMHYANNSEKKGFDANLTLGMMGMQIGVGGGYYDTKKTDEEFEASKDWDLKWVNDPENPESRIQVPNDRYNAFYLSASIDGGKRGIEIPGTGITITSIVGGFYYNFGPPECDASDYKKFCEQLMKASTKFGSVAFAFGLGLKWGESAAEINGKFSLLIAVDTKVGRLGTFKLVGDVEALEGNIKGNATICYEQKGSGERNDPDEEKHFYVSVTVSAKADMTDMLADFVGKENLDALKKTFNGDKKSGLGMLTNGEEDTKKEDDGKKENSNEDKMNEAAKQADGGFNAKMEAQINLLIDIKSRPYDPDPQVQGTKWMVCIGEPEASKRCSVTLLDLSVGKGDWKIWAKLYANAYLCFGNKLPGDGGLPDLPEPLKSFISDDNVGGEGKGGTSVGKEGGKIAELEAQRAEAINAIISGGATKGKANKGGVMFGLQAGADFGCRFGIGYVELGGLVGFDKSLKKMDESCRCLDEKGNLRRMGGKGGTYAEGQVYAYVYGAAGLILNLGFWSGDVPLLDLKLGAVLKGGTPNPSWAYGKLRAKGKLFGGLVKFDKKVEMKMGQVCMPVKGNPLDNIDIIEDTSIGYDNETEGYDEENAVEVFAPLTFTTNMGIGQDVPIFDEDLYQAKMGMDQSKKKAETAANESTRIFVFYLDPTAKASTGEAWSIQQGNTNTNFKVLTPIFDPTKQYKVVLKGWCKEKFWRNGKQVEEDPMIRDLDKGVTEQRAWGQEREVFFNTRPLSDDMSKAAMLVGPYDEISSEYDIKHPFVSLAYELPQFGKEGFEVLADLEEVVTDPLTGEQYLVLPDQLYNSNHERVTSSMSKYQGIKMRQLVEEGKGYRYITVIPVNQNQIDKLELKPDRTYRWTFYEMNTASMKKLLGTVEESYKKLSDGDLTVLEDLANNEEVQQWIKDSGNESLVAQMLADYQDKDNEFNANTLETRINSISADAYNRGSTFRSDILYIDTKCSEGLYNMNIGGKSQWYGVGQTFKEQMQNDMRTTETYKRELYSIKNPDSDPNVLTCGGIYFKPMGMTIGDNPDVLDIYNNPYHRLWWWNWKAMYPKDNYYANAMLYLTNKKNETGKRLRINLQGGYRALKSSEKDYYTFMLPEHQHITFQEFTDMFNPGGDNQWHEPIGAGIRYHLHTVETVFKFDNELVGRLDASIKEIFDTQIARDYRDGENAKKYGYDKVDGTQMTKVYEKYINDGRSMDLESEDVEGGVGAMESKDIKVGYGGTWYMANQNYNVPYSGTITYPAWQIGAMFMNSRYYKKGAHKDSDFSKFNQKEYESYTNYRLQQFLVPFDYINDRYSFYALGGTSAASSDELYDNISGAKKFQRAKNPAKYRFEYMVLRPNRVNVLADSVPGLDMPYRYHVSKTELGDRILRYTEDSEGNGTFQTLYEGMDGGYLFADKVVEKIVRKQLGKDENEPVTIAELESITEFENTTPGEVKSLADIAMMKNLVTFTWDSYYSIPTVEFSSNKKLREIVVINSVPSVDIDFSTCPNIEKLVLHRNAGGGSVTYSQGKAWNTYLATHLVKQPDMKDMQLLKYLEINYTDLTDIDLSVLPNLEFLDIRYNCLGDYRRKKEPYTVNGIQSIIYNEITTADDPEPYVFDLTKLPKQRSNMARVGHQMFRYKDGYIGLFDPAFLSYMDGTIDAPYYWNTNMSGRRVCAKVNDPELIRNMKKGGMCYDESVEVLDMTAVSANSAISVVREHLDGLDDNLRKVIFRDFGKAKMDKNGNPCTSSHLPNEVQYWIDLYELDLDKLKNEKSLDASECNVQSIDNLALYMPGIENLNFSGNRLTEADLRAFNNLKNIDLSANRLVKVSFNSSAAAIDTLDVSYNNIRELDLSYLTDLKRLDCSHNAIYQLDLSNQGVLEVLDCSSNSINDLDITHCPMLTDVNISSNTMRVAPNKLGFTLIADPGINSKLAKLYAASVIRETLPMCETQQFKNLVDLDLNGNSGLQALTISTQLLKLDVSNSGIEQVNVFDCNSQLFNDMYRRPALRELDAHNSNFGQAYPGFTVFIDREMDRVDLSECSIDFVEVTARVPELYAGKKIRNTMRIGIAFNDEELLADWDLNMKKHPKNANTYSYLGRVSDPCVLDILTFDVMNDDQLRLQKALGEQLYDYIKNDSTRVTIAPSVMQTLRVLDGRIFGSVITDLPFVLNEFPKLEEVYLRQGSVTDDALDMSKRYNRVEIVNPYSTTGESTIFKVHAPLNSNKSLLRINGYTIGNFASWADKAHQFTTVDLSGCNLENYDKEFEAKYLGVMRSFTADRTNIKKVSLSGKHLLNKLSLADCQELESLRLREGSLTSGKLKVDSLVLMQQYPNPDFCVLIHSAADAKYWLSNFASRYPELPVKLVASLADDTNAVLDMPTVEAEYLTQAIDAVFEKAKGMTSDKYNSRHINTEAEEAVIRTFWSTDSAYIANWTFFGKYPDGLHLDEIRHIKVLNLTNSHITDGKILADNRIAPTMIMASGGFDCETVTPYGGVISITLSDNASVKGMDLSKLTEPVGNVRSVNVAGTGFTSDNLNKAVAAFDYVEAMRLGEPLNVAIASDARCQTLDLSNSYVESVKIDKSLQAFKAKNVAGPEVVLYVNGELPEKLTKFEIDNDPKITIRTSKNEVLARWFTKYASTYPDVKVEVMVAGNMYVPVSSYNDAQSARNIYSQVNSTLSSGWQDAETLNIIGGQFDQKTLDFVLSNATKAKTLITGKNGVALKAPVFKVAAPMQTLDLSRFTQLSSISIQGDLADGSYVDVSGCTNLVSPNNLYYKAETVNASGCSSMYGTLTLNEEHKAHTVDISGTKIAEIELEKPVESITALNLAGPGLVLRARVLDPATKLDLDKSKLQGAYFSTREALQSWFDNFAADYPGVPVYVSYNDNTIEVGSVEDYDTAIYNILGKHLAAIRKNHPDATLENLDEITELDIRGVEVDDEFFNFVEINMPNATTVIADDVMWQMLQIFDSIVTRDSQSMSNLDISPDCNTKHFDVSDSPINWMSINSPIATLKADNLTSPSLEISTIWLPAQASALSLDGNADVTVRLDSKELVKRWFDVFAPVYPQVKVVYTGDGEDMEVTSSYDFEILPIISRNPGVTAAKLSKQTSINLDNCEEIAEMLEIVKSQCPKLKKLSVANNESYMPTFVYDNKNVEVNFGYRTAPLTLYINVAPDAGKIVFTNTYKLTVAFKDKDCAKAWADKYADKYPADKFQVEVGGVMKEYGSIGMAMIMAGMPANVGTMTTLDITGMGLTSDELNTVLEMMPKVSTIIAHDGGISAGETTLVLPARPVSYIKVDLSNNPYLKIVDFRGHAENVGSEIDLSKCVSLTEADDVFNSFAKINLNGCSKFGRFPTIKSNSLTSYLDLTGTRGGTLTLMRTKIDCLKARTANDLNLQIYSLPEDVNNFDIDGSKTRIVLDYKIGIDGLKKWYAEYADKFSCKDFGYNYEPYDGNAIASTRDSGMLLTGDKNGVGITTPYPYVILNGWCQNQPVDDFVTLYTTIDGTTTKPIRIADASHIYIDVLEDVEKWFNYVTESWLEVYLLIQGEYVKVDSYADAQAKVRDASVINIDDALDRTPKKRLTNGTSLFR